MWDQIRVVLLLATVGCAASPKIGEVAVTTPEHYSENKVLFADHPHDEQGGLRDRRALLHAEQIVHRELCVSDPQKVAAARSNYVKKLDPLGVILRGVRIPKDCSPPRDIAVVLDIVTAGEENVTSLVVFYQREVPGGQMLNFQDLLVYYDPEWDGVTPPWFRVRVLDVKAERNERTRFFLTEAAKLSGGLAGIVPHPVLPAVSTAIDAAKLVLGNKSNKVIVDYQVQFYSPAQIAGAGGVPLSPLRKGEWLVVGRARGETSRFWKRELELEYKTGQLWWSPPQKTQAGKSAVKTGQPKAKVVEVPYVSVVLMVADAAVPKHILDRSQELLRILDSPTERVNFDSLANNAVQLTSALTAYKHERMIRKYGSTQDFRDLMLQLTKQQDAKKAGRAPPLLEVQERTLVRLASSYIEKQSLGSIGELLTWWEASGSGSLQPDENAPNGYYWVVTK